MRADPGSGAGHPREVDLRLPLRTRAGLLASRAASRLSSALGRGHGTVIGGLIARRIDPATLRRLAAGRDIVLVSATNGKSTTSALLAAALRTLGPVAHNDGGSNMAEGLVVALDADRRAGRAVLEVDELYLGPLLAATRPRVLTLMNVARDYLERGVRYKRLVRHWRTVTDGLDRPLAIVANADDPLVAWSVDDHPDVVWVAGGHPWAGDGLVCRDCLVTIEVSGDDWHCPGCGRRRPTPTWRLEGDRILGPGVDVRPAIAMPGRVNRINALFALATAVTMGVPAEAAAAAFGSVVDVDGRYGRRDLDGRLVRLLLSKNPASWQETVEMLERADDAIVFSITARGDRNARDVSFVWEAPIERLAGRPVVATGVRAHDIALRLEVAGLDVTVVPDPFDAIRACPPGRVTVATNYPAFLELRDALPAARMGEEGA